MEDKLKMLEHALLDEDGNINPMAMGEFSEEISAMGETYQRLRNDPEWSLRENRWTFKSDIVGAFAKWACRQSPYGVPDGLETVCKYLNSALSSVTRWREDGLTEASLCDINRWLHEILMNQGIELFDAWNEPKIKNGSEFHFVSRYSEYDHNPDEDFICLAALLHNVAIEIRDERRKNKAFEEAHGF